MGRLADKNIFITGGNSGIGLSPGDVVVQNGTRHRWRMIEGAPATVAAFIIGAHRR